MSVLVGILHCEEAEFNACIAALRAQRYQEFEVFVLEDLPNKQAHDELYRRFMEGAAKHRWFLKLDADMVLRSPSALGSLVDEFQPDTAHLMAYVNDRPSGLRIPGIQMFRSDSIWEASDDLLNVDHPPRLQGQSKLLVNCDLVDHMPEPGDQQLFRYGVHKALKSIQPDQPSKNIGKGILHAAILNGIARNYFAGRRELAWSLIGAMLVYSNNLTGIDYNSPQNLATFRQLRDEHHPLENAAMLREVEAFWGNEVQSLYRWLHLFQNGPLPPGAGRR